MLDAHVPAQCGSETHRKGRECCTVVPVRLDVVRPLGSEELAEEGWAQCWALSAKIIGN